MALADRAELAVRLTLDDRGFTGPLRKVKSNLSGLDKATSNTRQALGRTGAALQRTALIAAGAATGGFLAAVNAAADFEDAFQGIVKTVDAPTARLEELREQVRAMAREMPVAATELAAIGETAGALGIAPDFIDEFIETVAKLGVTTNLTSDEAADALGRITTILGFTGAEIQTFASALVALGNQGASTEAEIIEVTKRFAASGAQAGLTTDQILAYASAISSLGAEPEAAGSSLSRIFSNLINETATASAKGKEFAEVAGVSFKKFSSIVKDDTNEALLLFLDGLGKLDKFEASKALEDVGITNVRDRDAILKLAQNTGFLREQLDLANGAIKDTSAIDQEAAKRFDTFNSKLQIAKNILTDVGITIGNKLLPKITPLLEEFGTFVRTNGDEIEDFGDRVADAFVGVIDTLRSLPWDSIQAGLKVSADLARITIDAFKSLPGPLQAALIGGFAVNKVTGGLLTGIGKDLGGLALNKLFTGSFLERGSTPANPMWVATVGGPLGGVGAAATGATGLKGVLGLGGGLVGLLKAWFPAAIIGGAIAAAIGPPIADWVERTVTENWRAPIQRNPNTGEVISFNRGSRRDPGMTTDVGVRDAVIRASTQERVQTAVLTAATNAKLEQNRLAIANMTNRTATGLSGLAGTIRDKDWRVTFSPRINVGVSVRTFNQKSKVSAKLGFVAS